MHKEKRDQFCAENERAKYQYRIHLRRALKKDEKTTIATLKHLRDYELYTNFQAFSTFNDILADKYVTHMLNTDISLSYIDDNIRALKNFLRWLERQRGYKSKLQYNHIDYLNISANQKRIAKAMEYKQSYTYEQILNTICQMPSHTLVEQRNKAMISLQALCGLRVSELRTVKLKNIMQEEGCYFVYVNPKDMQVKYAKIRHANFMPLPKDIVRHVIGWHNTLLERGFTEKDPLFPVITARFNQTNMLQREMTHQTIASNASIIRVFKNAFEAAGYPYIRPHSFRHTMVRFAETQSPEFLNAVRQALGHSSINTTFQSYGQLSEIEQRRRISRSEIHIGRGESPQALK